jgi:hypothetical protein
MPWDRWADALTDGAEAQARHRDGAVVSFTRLT